MTFLWILLALLALDLAAVVILTLVAGRMRRSLQACSAEATEDLSPANLPDQRVGPAAVGKTHHIGKRPSQQDSCGKAAVFGGQGILAVVADGMGGLSGGEQVSQRVVMEMLSLSSRLQTPQLDGVLLKMVRYVNESVNRMLGPGGIYKSGSTLLAVLATATEFQWIAVGDSRIYLCRDGCMLQLNQEHTQLQAWMPEILNGTRSYAESVRDPNSGKLTSFIGMGKLRAADLSLRSIAIAPGDRILLMTDGVFNALPEAVMAELISKNPNVQQAADALEQAVLQANVPGQDNFTAMILGF